MSDFIYSSISKPQGKLTRHIQSIYHNDPPEVFEYHGDWGSLGVTRNLYNGFQPLETDEHIFVVIGGPVLCFQSNRFLTGSDPVFGARAIYERWLSGTIQWDDDLSGPFLILSLDKANKKITCVTDLMMFIPAYQYCRKDALMLGTHVDALARAARQSNELDPVSLVDFILNDVVTYPYTTYKNIRQCHPAAVHDFQLIDELIRSEGPSPYWLPREQTPYANIDEAAKELRVGLQDYVNGVTEGMHHVAQFISAGEDSRAVAGLLPQRLKRDGFVFLNSMNREGKIARKVAQSYKINFHPAFRNETHYLDIMSEASDLVGSGHQYVHAHSLGLHKSSGLNNYSAVFGGYLSDTFLKGMYAYKKKLGKVFPFEFFVSGETRSFPLRNSVFDEVILKEIDARRISHFQKLQALRPLSAHEWFPIWPRTMGNAIPNLFVNRRLFKSYEPFMCKESVKIAVAVPTKWKLNCRLFNRACRPYLKPSLWIFHADGRLPYFPWWVNTPVQFSVRLSQKIGTRTGMIKGNQGPWGDWNQVIADKKWEKAISKYANGFEIISHTFNMRNLKQLFAGRELTIKQKINLLQVVYFLTDGFYGTDK